MDQIDALWRHLDKLNRNDPTSYLETIEKLKAEQERLDKERDKVATVLVGEISCHAEKLGTVQSGFCIKVGANEKAPYPEDTNEPIRLCLAHEEQTNCLVIIANTKMLGEVYKKQEDIDLFMDGLAPFILAESGWHVSKLKLNVEPEKKGEKIALKKPESGPQPKEEMNVNLVEKLKELTTDGTAAGKKSKKSSKKKKKKVNTVASEMAPEIKIHDDNDFHIAESKSNRLTWVDDFTAKLLLPGHTTASQGVDVDATTTHITIKTEAPTNLSFEEKLASPLTISQVDGIIVKFKKKDQTLTIKIPQP